MKREFSQKDSFWKGRLGERKTVRNEGYEKDYLRQKKIIKILLQKEAHKEMKTLRMYVIF